MFKQLKLWKSIISLNTRNVITQVITSVVCVACALLSPIALSYFISFVSSAEFSLALLWLGIDLALKLLEQLSWHFNYSNFTRLIAPTYLSLQEKLTSTVLKGVPKDKKDEFDYVEANDIYTISVYIDKIILRLSNLIKFVVVSAVIFFYSYAIGTIILAVSVLGYFILCFYMGQRGKSSKDLYRKEISVTKKFQEIQDKRDIIKKYNLENAVAFEENRRLDDYVKSYDKATKTRSLKENLLKIYWIIALSVCLAILVYEFRQATLTLTVFLAVYNYLLMYARITENVFDFRLETQELAVALERYNGVVDIESEIQKQVISVVEDVTFPRLNARVNAKEKTVKIPKDTVAVFRDGEYKRMFSMPAKGFKINDLEVSKVDIDKVCKFVSYENEMFDDTIIENLQIINPDLKEIANCLHLSGLTRYIDGLSDKEYANISNCEDRVINFKFNLVKACLSDSKIIFCNLDELDDEDLSSVLRLIILMKKNRIFLLLDERARVNRKKILIVE